MKTPNHPYEFLDRNVEAVQTASDQAPVNKQRELKDIENGMIDDTLSLIGILDGSTATSNHLLDGERTSNAPFDAALFLDKSGRPVSQLTRDIWSSATDKPRPQSLFLNIDKRPWLHAMGFQDGSDTNLEDISPDDLSLDKIDPELLHDELSRIRALYLEPADFNRIDEDKLDEVWQMPTRLDGETIAIIDEVKSSGNTLRIALELLRRAIPEASFEGMWWSTPHTISWEGGEDVNYARQKAATVVPVWYDAKRESGRGIGDIDSRHSAMSPSKAQRIGRSILSAPERDNQGNYVSHRSLSATIRRDIGRLAMRFKDRELERYVPSVADDDEFDRRIELYYQEPAETVYKRWRSEQNR